MAEQKKIKYALTVHDLPAWPHWTSPEQSSPTSIVEAMTAALTKHGIKDVYALSNSGTGLLEPETKEVYHGVLDKWVAGGQHIGNHTHNHLAVHDTNTENLKWEIDEADRQLAPWMKTAPSKMFCFATDCQGTNPEQAQALQDHLEGLNYHVLPGSNMLFEWRWEMAYLGAKCRKDEVQLAWIRKEFPAYAVRQMLFDREEAVKHWGEGVILVGMLHTLSIVGDLIDDLLQAFKDAGVEFVTAEEGIATDEFKKSLGKADYTVDPVTAYRKLAASELFEKKLEESKKPGGKPCPCSHWGKEELDEWPEYCPSGQALMAYVEHLGLEALNAGHITMKHKKAEAVGLQK